jgi:alpha-D-ribose 1-methylphosphonate 5-phosphate C-P lyase
VAIGFVRSPRVDGALRGNGQRRERLSPDDGGCRYRLEYAISPMTHLFDPRLTKEDRVAEKYSGEAYCVKCKEKRQFEGEVVVNDKGTKMAKGKCHVCGTTLNRILGKA